MLWKILTVQLYSMPPFLCRAVCFNNSQNDSIFGIQKIENLISLEVKNQNVVPVKFFFWEKGKERDRDGVKGLWGGREEGEKKREKNILLVDP